MHIPLLLFLFWLMLSHISLYTSHKSLYTLTTHVANCFYYLINRWNFLTNQTIANILFHKSHYTSHFSYLAVPKSHLASEKNSTCCTRLCILIVLFRYTMLSRLFRLVTCCTTVPPALRTLETYHLLDWKRTGNLRWVCRHAFFSPYLLRKSHSQPYLAEDKYRKSLV